MNPSAWLWITALGWAVAACQSGNESGGMGGFAGVMAESGASGAFIPAGGNGGTSAAGSNGGAVAAAGRDGADAGTSAAGTGATAGSAGHGLGGADGSAGGARPSDSGAGGPQSTDGGSTGTAGAGQCPFGTAEFFLWPGTAPGSENVTLTEKVQELSNTPGVHDRHITDVSKPSVFAYLAPHPNGAAALIMPGGAYSLLAFDLEGVDIANWLTSIGISAFVVKYRLPADFPQTWIALADAQRAMRLVRNSASACGIDPKRIGVVGFSAGGNNASQLETRPSAVTTPLVDDIDKVDARPNFGLLLYPVITMDPSLTHTGSRNNLIGSNPSAADVLLYSSEKQVTASTPPTFIGVSKKDTGVNPQNSVVFDNALKAAQVADELHLYNDGAHGTGIRLASGDMAQWPAQAAAWLAKMKFTSAVP